MRKIKECINDSMSRIKLESGLEMTPLCLGYFLTSMATILLFDARERVKAQYHQANIGDETLGGGIGKENPTIEDCLDVLSHRDFMRSISQQNQLNGFLNWFVEQNEPDDDVCWYELDFVAMKWNQFAKESARS